MKQLREKLSRIATEMRDMHQAAVDADAGFTAEQRTKWDALLADYESVEQRIKDAEAVARLEGVPEGRALPSHDKEENTIVVPKTPSEFRATPEYSAAYDNFLRGAEITTEQREMLRLNQAEMQLRAQGIATDGAGGFTVPEGFAGYISERMAAFSGLYGAANPGGNGGPTLLRTSSGNVIPFPTNDDTSNVGELLAENTPAAEQDTVFGARNLGAYMFSSKLIRVSLQLLQDEAVNLQSYIGNILGKRLGRAVAPYFANGTGTAQPTGLATAATDNGLNLSAGAGYSYGALLNFEHSLDPAYRGSASWVFNDNTLKALKGLLDANLRPLWLPGLAGSLADNSQRPSLMGYGYVIDQSFDDLATGGNYMAFGDLSEFIIREVLGINMFRFNERYMDALQIGWLGYARWDSNLIDTSAVVTDIAVA